jgi:O-succinylbenzoic acid--CoA ligase
MDYSRITGITPAAAAFMKEWSEGDFITAHTSGSTGAPKLIRLRKSDMIESAKATNAFLGITAASVLAMPLSADYIAGKMMIVRSLIAGCRLHIAEPSLNPLQGFEHLPAIDMMPVVPAQTSELLKNGRIADKVRCVIVGGAPMGAAAEKALADSGVRAYATYGMTETCSHVALRRIGIEDHYTALPGIWFATDSRGCLIIHSDRMSFGSLTTNDCVELLSPCSFRWLGRADNVINSGGVKVYPEKLERQIAPLLGDRAFYISGRASEQWGTEIILTVEGEEFDRDRFMSAASEILPKRLLPKEIIVTDSIERTQSGKIKRAHSQQSQ